MIFIAAKKEVKKKKCPICGNEKSIATGFYKSSSPMFSLDKCVPICISCVKKEVVNENGTVNENKLKTMCQRLDKPFYSDELDSAFLQQKRENGYLSDDEVAKCGEKIVGFYFKNINTLRQNKDKSFADSEKEGFIHQNSNRTKKEKNEILNRYSHLINQYSKPNKIAPPSIRTLNKHNLNIDDFEVTEEIKSLFGDGYDTLEYKKMFDKYEKLKINYTLQTNIHQEALATYVRFKVKEEDATAKGNVDEAKKWYDAAQNAAEKAKLTPKQLTKADLDSGVNSVSELTKAVEQAVDVIKIMPQFKYRPNDAPDFNIWCYVDYERKLNDQPPVSYEDVYSFYDKRREEYISQNGDPYGIFSNEPTLKNRETVKTFIKLPDDYEELAGDAND